MAETTLDSIKNRISANAFDPARKLSNEEIEELVGYAIEAPSSFNIQHWRFIAVTGDAEKQTLKSLAYNQQKVVDAPVTFIILGDLLGHTKLPDIVARAVAAGVIAQPIADYFVNGAAGLYSNYTDERLVRDEAVRSAAFAAMTLQLAAQAKGLVSGPMIGFDFEGVKKAFGIDDRYVLVMLLAVGYEAPGNWVRKPRLAVSEVLAYNAGREF